MIKILVYESGAVREGTLEDVAKGATVSWVDIENPSEEELAVVARLTQVETPELEEYLGRGQMAVTKNYENYSLLIFRSALRAHPEAFTQPFVILVSKKNKDFITLHRHPSRSMERIYSYPPHRLAGLFAKGPTMLLHALLDEFIESYRVALSAVEDVVEEVEEAVMSGQSGDMVLKHVLGVKKALAFYRKDLAANREVLSSLQKEYADQISRNLVAKFRLHYADLTSLYDSVSIYHDILSTAMEVHFSMISNNLNLTIKRVTSWGAIILVPTFVATLYGMNFKQLPMADTPYGFWILLALMAGSVFALERYFKKRDWL